MDIRNLRTFMTIVEEGSFAGAARRLDYTQSAITFQMNQLEQDLSAHLFEKIGRSMTLTKAGHQLVPYVEHVLAALEEMNGFESDLHQYCGELKIGVAETVLSYKLPEALKNFHSLAPRAKLIFRNMNCYDIRDGILDGTLDMGIFYRDVGGFGQEIICHEIGTYPVSMVASPEVAAGLPDLEHNDQTLELPFIINEPRCIFRQIFEKYLQEHNIRIDYCIDMMSIPAAIRLVENNVGISFLPTFTITEELARGSLVEIPIPADPDAITAVCGYHRNKWVSPVMQLFMDTCLTMREPAQENEKKSLQKSRQKKL